MTTIHRRSPHYVFGKSDQPGASRYDRKRTRKALRASAHVPPHEAHAMLDEERDDAADLDTIADAAQATGRMQANR